jgi:hypothetical protein
MDQSEAENHVVYSGCREFRGESTMHFTDAEEVPYRSSEQTLQRLSLPGNLSFKLALRDPINSAVAAAGDIVNAKLKTAIRDKAGNVLVPESAAITGRIVKMQYSYDTAGRKVAGAELRGMLTIGIRLETLGSDGIRQSLAARVDTSSRRFVKMQGFSVRVELGHVDPADDPETAMFDFPDVGPNYVVQPGLESSWLTISPGSTTQSR